MDKDEWLLYQIRKTKIQTEIKDGTRKMNDVKCILSPIDEANIRRSARKAQSEKDHKTMLASIYAQKDAEMEARRIRYIATGKYD